MDRTPFGGGAFRFTCKHLLCKGPVCAAGLGFRGILHHCQAPADSVPNLYRIGNCRFEHPDFSPKRSFHIGPRSAVKVCPQVAAGKDNPLKGLSCLLIESFQAAKKFGVVDTIQDSFLDSFGPGFQKIMDGYISGAVLHAARRQHEMENVVHVHSAPDVMPRKMDDLEMAQRVIQSGMAGYALKSHYFCTAERASLLIFLPN